MNPTTYQARMYAAAAQSSEWFTNADIMDKADVTNGTATRFTRYLMKIGSAEKMDIHPAPLFRLLPSHEISREARKYIAELLAIQSMLETSK